LNRQSADALLKKYFGYDVFRKGQQEIIEQILAGRDVLAVMPTGSGKSLCYQIPALALTGLSIIVSPLISLMKDQTDVLRQADIPAAFINSALSPEAYREVIANAQKGRYKLLYIAPERLQNEDFLALAAKIRVSMVAVDEAHCVSQWGHDFRPSYVEISKWIQKLPQRPVIAAFTATATPVVKEDIIRLLRLTNPFSLSLGFDRENLYFEVQKPADKFARLQAYLEGNRNKSGIVYASTRKTVDAIFEKLHKKGFAVSKYHAGMAEKERTKSQEDFLYDRTNIMAATNAFGMGIDKSNVSFVIHYNMPKNLESYYQEAGRAGRDGEKAQCILYYSPADTITNKFLIEKSGDGEEKVAEYQRLSDMVAYCNTDQCLRASILGYFGESGIKEHCGNCGNCNSGFEETDITTEAQKIMSCIRRTGERFGGAVIANVLRGRQTQRLKDLGFDSLSTFGIMKEYAKETLMELIAFLTADGYISSAGDQYPVLRLNEVSTAVLRGDKQVVLRRVLLRQASADETKADAGLFERLKALRKSIAEEENVPPYVIFSNATLMDMCQKLPSDAAGMLNVSGVGSRKLHKYGQAFLSVIQDYTMAQGEDIDQDIRPAKKRKERKRKPKGDTQMETLALYKNGWGIAEIAEGRGLEKSTVEGHLLALAQKGEQIGFERLYPKEQEKLILSAIQAFGGKGLKAVKEALPAEVSYGAIRFVLQKMNKK
jgi:ATP-dependent DNA helicase RecQ